MLCCRRVDKRIAARIWVFTKELVEEVGAPPLNENREPPQEAAQIVEAIKSHTSFRSLTYQIEGSPTGHQSMIRVRVQYWRTLREPQIKSSLATGKGNCCLGGCWVAPSSITGAAPQLSLTANMLRNFKTSGVPEGTLEKRHMPQANRILGPWEVTQEGLHELIEILETAEQPADGGGILSEKEAKVACVPSPVCVVGST